MMAQLIWQLIGSFLKLAASLACLVFLLLAYQAEGQLRIEYLLFAILFFLQGKD